MSVETIVKKIAEKFEYKQDIFKLFDWWFVIDEKDGKMRGDCEDFSLTVIWHLCDRNLLTFIWKVFITHQYRIYFCKTKTNEGHAVGFADGKWFDNWTLEALSKEEFLKRTGHKIKFFIPSPMIIFNMILGAFAVYILRK